MPSDARQYISRRVLDTVRQTREPVLATNVASGVGPSSVEMSLSRVVGDLWVIAVPFRPSEESIDVLYATVPRDCGTAEWLSLYALAAEVYIQGEATWAARMHAQAHAAIERELETARQIQVGLVPPDYAAPGLDVTVGFQPCKWVGGDYVDVVPLPRGRVLLAIADVCGKGLQAALVGSSLHTMVRAAVDMDPPLAQLVERVNRHLLDWLPEHSFVTMAAVALDPATGELECVNAGHPPVIIVGKGGAITELQAAENPALGIDQTRMIAQRASLQPGEVLAMYTDGLTELTGASGEMFGGERLASELGRIYGARHRDGVAAIGADLDARLDAFRGDEVPGDDRTYLLAQRH
jgi:serine phosphatase RsbU (regulator of sigma subunit)